MRILDAIRADRLAGVREIGAARGVKSDCTAIALRNDVHLRECRGSETQSNGNSDVFDHFRSMPPGLKTGEGTGGYVESKMASPPHFVALCNCARERPQTTPRDRERSHAPRPSRSGKMVDRFTP